MFIPRDRNSPHQIADGIPPNLYPCSLLYSCLAFYVD